MSAANKEPKRPFSARLPNVGIYLIRAIRRFYKCRNDAEALELLLAKAARAFLNEQGIMDHLDSTPGVRNMKRYILEQERKLAKDSKPIELAELVEYTPRSIMGDAWRLIDVLMEGDKASYKIVYIPAGSVWDKAGYKGPVVLAKDETLTEKGRDIDNTIENKLIPDWLEEGSADDD